MDELLMNETTGTGIPENMESVDSITGTVTETMGAERSEFTRPAHQFRGSELLPFTYGYELLFNQVRDPEDTGLFTWLAFVFLLSRRNGENADAHRKWAINSCWRVASFREELIKWMDQTGPFTNNDKLEAKRIYEESMKAIIETAVEVVPGKGARSSQKKMHRLRKH